MFTFKYFHIPRTLSRSYCTRALQVLEKVIKKPQKGIIHLIVLDSEEMARMNQQFRGKEGPTDILTFSFREGGKRQKVKGKRGGLVILPPEKGGQGGLDSTSLPPMAGLAGMTETVAGEIYLCLEKIKSYAKDAGKTYKEQLEYIIIHGLVHLMGYDHETDADWREMEKVEQSIIHSFKKLT